MSHYTRIFVNKMSEAIREEIGQEELHDKEKFAMMFHAMANMAPAYMYVELTGNQVNSLEFNHMANKLIFNYNKEEPKAAG